VRAFKKPSRKNRIQWRVRKVKRNTQLHPRGAGIWGYEGTLGTKSRFFRGVTETAESVDPAVIYF